MLLYSTVPYSNILLFFQLHNSLYYLQHLTIEGSWDDAERVCRRNDAHLWAINSYSEWKNLLTYFGFGKIVKEGDNLISGIDILQNAFLAIGLRVYNQVYVNQMFATCIIET